MELLKAVESAPGPAGFFEQTLRAVQPDWIVSRQRRWHESPKGLAKGLHAAQPSRRSFSVRA
jgi:hypothetical protein